uniref:Uncharacterized protein n=1 Tax=Chelonoidis abingdonii TaxID=106734 RepID=A0A8C0INU2_CHEAB
MALSRLGCCRGGLHGGLLGVGPVTVPANCLRRVLRAPEPVPAWRALRSCCLSTKTNPKALLAAVVSQFKYANGKYESFLERTFPRFYVLYSTFLKVSQGPDQGHSYWASRPSTFCQLLDLFADVSMSIVEHPVAKSLP